MNALRFAIIALLAVFYFFGCASLERHTTKVLNRSSNSRLIKIDSDRAIVQYEYGALIDELGEAKAQELIHNFCSADNYKIVLKGTLQSGDKQWTQTIVMHCL